MPFRDRFDCLWCGRPWTSRARSDLEGWASLCPDCLGRAGENGFLRTRLRAALRERAEGEGSVPGPADDEDDWYLRRGRHAAGPLLDVPWQAELDQATRWLDGLPLPGVIVELGAGSGWWSALLAQKGELWVTDTDPSRLDVARRRLVAHGLLAHIHARDPLAAPDRQVDAVFSAFLLGACGDESDLEAQCRVVRAWLRPGGTFAFIEAGSAEGDATVPGPRGRVRAHPPALLRATLARCGFEDVDIQPTDRSFLMGSAAATA